MVAKDRQKVTVKKIHNLFTGKGCPLKKVYCDMQMYKQTGTFEVQTNSLSLTQSPDIYRLDS